MTVSPTKIWHQILCAHELLTRLPLSLSDSTRQQSRAAYWAYFSIGLTISFCVVAFGYAVLTVFQNLTIAVLLALGLSFLLTGAMHEDGLADCADGFWGGWDREKRLLIMKDSQIGTYGVLALVLAVVLKFTLWHSHALDFWAMAASAAASRAMMPAIMATTDHARRDGLSHYVGRPSKRQASIGLFISVIFLGWSFSSLGLLAFGAACLVAIGLRFVALRKVGGQTGDVLGATQILCELMILMVLLP